MNVFTKSVIYIAVALLVIPKDVFGQYEFPMHPFLSYFKDIQRYEISFNYTMPSGYYDGVSQVTSNGYTSYNNNIYNGDTTARRTISTTGFGGAIGLSLPFKATGHISCWAAAIQLAVNMHTWTNLNSYYGTDGSINAPTGTSLNANTMQVSLPIGIDWKVGNDAIKSQRLAFGASFGAGFIPQINVTSLSGVSGFETMYGYGFTPYAKVEGAFRLGWDVKIRVMYTLGDISLLTVNREIPGVTDGPFQIVSTNCLTLSLVLMPFSGGWKETDWWNTHDTYNQHDRFN